MSLGIPGNFTSKKFLDVEKKILDEAKKFNKTFGTHLINPSKNEIEKALKKKYKFIACGVDFKIIGDSLKNIV